MQEQWQPRWNQWACLDGCLGTWLYVPASRSTWTSGGAVFKPPGDSPASFPGTWTLWPCDLTQEGRLPFKPVHPSLPSGFLAWQQTSLLLEVPGAFPGQIHTNKYHMRPALPWALVSHSAPEREDPLPQGSPLQVQSVRPTSTPGTPSLCVLPLPPCFLGQRAGQEDGAGGMNDPGSLGLPL